MVDKLSNEQREVGAQNYYAAVGSYYDVNRRDFLRGIVAAGAVSGAGLGAAYFGYGRINDPVRIAIIGTGDEGNVLIGGCNPNYVDVKAICDIRPYSIHRAFHGDWSSPAALERRPGLIRVAGYQDEAEARRNVKVYGSIMDCLDDQDIEAIVIALPLFLHAPVAAQAMQRGLHVLTEKLMARTVAQCKVMSRMAAELEDTQGNPIHLATGHQRHYNVKYDNAVNLIRWGLLGQLNHIRAQWHRGNLPGSDSWSMPIPGGERTATGEMFDRIASDIAHRQKQLTAARDPSDIERLEQEIALWKAWDDDKHVDPKEFGYQDFSIGDKVFTAMQELHRWRLFERTGAGLMAELGSHQLDAVSIFLSSLRDDGKKVHPLSVHAVGGLHIMPVDREVGDHVYCMYEFPGPEYDKSFDVGYYDRVLNFPEKEKNSAGDLERTGPVAGFDTDPNRKVVVTYSSINGNGFGGWGEVVMGTKGTLILDKETDVLLYRNSDTSSKVGVAKQAGGYALDTSASGDYSAPVAQAADSGPVSRGYREQIEHWAYCIRNPSPENQVRCYPEVAMGDAVIALATNVALKNANAGKGGFLKFDEEWFQIDSDATPDGSSIAAETEFMNEPIA